MEKSINLRDYLDKGGELKPGHFLDSNFGSATFLKKVDNNYIMVKFDDGEISKMAIWSFYVYINQ